MRYVPLKQRFEEKYVVDETTGCWVWRACTDKKGYGRITVGRLSKRAQRISYYLYREDPRDMHVLHKCDNPGCVNPEHLFLGTNEENVQDKVEKNRQCKGVANNKAKLTPEIAEEIRREYKTGRYTQRGLGRKYGVSQHSIWQIIKRKTWAD